MKSHLKTFLLLLSVIIGFGTSAQSIKIDDEVYNWECAFNAGLNNDGYEFGFSGLYFPVQYFGIKISLGFAGEIEEMGDWGNDYESNDYAVRFKFNPAIAFRTPRLINLKNQDAGFYLFAEPGVVLSPGARGSKFARYFNKDLKVGINFQITRLVISIGYGISDFSLYSGSPDNHWGLPAGDTEYTTHTVFLGVSCKF